MASFNKITIVGYLGRDPELRYTPQGTAVCSFSIATTERRKDKSGEMQDQTTWFKVAAWNRLAEVANQYLSKGKQVYIEGRLRTEEYTDKEGKLRTSLEVTANDIQFIGARGDEAGMSSGASAPARPAAAPPSQGGHGGGGGMDNGAPVTDEDIPF
ncbi:MAG: single-stranded DNA-binding protein [Blastocatellia bacterium]